MRQIKATSKKYVSQPQYGACWFNQNLTFQPHRLRLLGCIPFKDDLDGVHYIYHYLSLIYFSTFFNLSSPKTAFQARIRAKVPGLFCVVTM